MSNHERRLVLDLGFEAALGIVCRSVREQGLETIARVDVRDHFWQELCRDFRQYALLEIWSPEVAFELLHENLDLGAAVPVTLAVYARSATETAVVCREPLGELAKSAEWQHRVPALAAIAERESARIARVFETLSRASAPSPSTPVA